MEPTRVFFISCSSANLDSTDVSSQTWVVTEEFLQEVTELLNEKVKGGTISILVGDISDVSTLESIKNAVIM